MRKYMLIFFFFNDTATTEIYTLSLHDALPIYRIGLGRSIEAPAECGDEADAVAALRSHCCPKSARFRLRDRKSTRLNSSHANISYAVFCLKKKKNYIIDTHRSRILIDVENCSS